MKIKSNAFQNGEIIPSKYTCDDQNINPPLEFSDIPKNAKSLVLIMEDPDVPKSIRPDGMWDHWILFNIPPETSVLAEGKNAGLIGKNTGEKNAYQGPCPPDREHRYFFKLFAVDKMLDLEQGAGKNEVLNAIKWHIVAQAELMGRYERNSS